MRPEGHTNISRSEADLEIRVSDFESTASGGSGALFPTSGEQELLSGEKLQDPLQTVQTPVLGGSQSEGRQSSPRHFLATLLSVSHKGDQGASEKVTLRADVDEKVAQQDQKHALQTAAESLQAPVNAAYVGTSMWLVMKPVGTHRPTCETPPPSISLTSKAVPRKKTCGKRRCRLS